ncbi:transcription termination/antitermination NusG family protein [Phenylobacterium sp.]|uniref:transcription termination/antitermination NusG family protein n=1 Tax=Phenylobacterium sp. TaxID=1871053 RepID=UPI0039541641
MTEHVDLASLNAVAAVEHAAQAAPKRVREEGRIDERRADGPWLVVITKPNQEKTARANLIKQGFEVYLPLRLLDEASAKRRGVEAVPLFPRIIFARATLDADRWQSIFSTIGVARVMCDPWKPRGVTQAFIDRIRREEVDGFVKLGLRDASKPRHDPKPAVRDHRQWRKLGDVVDGLLSVGVDEARKSVLVSLLNEGRAALTADLRKI